MHFSYYYWKFWKKRYEADDRKSRINKDYRKVLKETMMGNILYHYCSVDAFYNILKNATIWLSDVSKSNDYQECVLCRDRVNAAIEKIMSENEEDLEAWKWGIAHGSELNREIYTYCACFSESCDQLSQWRGYANNGKGMAIGFDKDLLQELAEVDKRGISFAPILYDRDKQDEYVKEIVEDNIRKLEFKGIGHVGVELNTNYRLKFPFLKNSSFWEEKEWRIVVCSRPGANQKKVTYNFQFSEVRYRVLDEKLISYIEMDFSKIKKELIKEIWIGPKSEVEISDVENFLYTCGYYEGVAHNTDEPILIEKSSSSYR